MKHIFLSVLSITLFSVYLNAQNIVYADISKGDVVRMNFEILGKSADNYLVYKETKGKHRISVYDHNMELREEVPVEGLPKSANLLDVSFYNNDRNYYLLYQYQEGDVVFLKARKIEANGRMLEESVLLDTTMISYKTERKIYSTAISNNKSKLLAFKINKKDRARYRFTTKLFDTELNPLNESQFWLPMEYKGDYLTGYSIANDGSFAFIKYHRQTNGNITDASLVEKPANQDSYEEHKLNVNDLFLDDIKLMVDDHSSRYLLTSFYSTQKRGDIDGLYVFGLNKNSHSTAFEKTTLFTDDLKQRAKGKSNTKNAFNDFFINNIVVNPDGGFTIVSERLYSFDNWDRWGYWGAGPGWGWGGLGMWGGWGPGWGGWWPYSYYSPFFYRSYWWGGWAPGWNQGSQQFNAGNIAMLNFDSEGNQTWDNVIVKSQRETNTDGSISYQLMPGNNGLRFLINNSQKITSLENIIINSDGSTRKGNGIKAKDKRIDFMPRYGQQTGENEIIIPYSYKGNISFAKINF